MLIPKNSKSLKNNNLILFSILILFFSIHAASAQTSKPHFQFVVSFPDPASHLYNVELHCSQWKNDTIHLKMPQWMPGYYQIMDYAKSVENMQAKDAKGNSLPIKKINGNTWTIAGIKGKSSYLKTLFFMQRDFLMHLRLLRFNWVMNGRTLQRG